MTAPLTIILLLWCPHLIFSDERSAVSRAEFAHAMSAIKPGATRDQVLDALGVPDAIRRGQVVLTYPGRPNVVEARDWEATLGGSDASEIWHYGTDVATGFPTLGRVYFRQDGGMNSHVVRVHQVYGTGDPSAKLGKLAESDLRRLISVLGEENRCQPFFYDPRRIIAAVNSLWPLGTDLALAVVEEYLRVCPAEHGSTAEKLMLLLRVLFDVPGDSGHMPEIGLGTTPPPPSDARLVPRFPIQIIDDIPLLVVAGYHCEGLPRSIHSELKYFREKAKLRRSNLVPTDDPLRALQKLEQSAAWTYTSRTDRDRAMIICQLLTLVDPIKAFPDHTSRVEFSLRASPANEWRRFLSEFQTAAIRWDTKRQEYKLITARER